MGLCPFFSRTWKYSYSALTESSSTVSFRNHPPIRRRASMGISTNAPRYLLFTLHSSKTSVPLLIVRYGASKMLLIEVRPVDAAEPELAVGTLIEQEIGQPEFSAGSDDQFRIRLTTGV